MINQNDGKRTWKLSLCPFHSPLLRHHGCFLFLRLLICLNLAGHLACSQVEVRIGLPASPTGGNASARRPARGETRERYPKSQSRRPDRRARNLKTLLTKGKSPPPAAKLPEVTVPAPVQQDDVAIKKKLYILSILTAIMNISSTEWHSQNVEVFVNFCGMLCLRHNTVHYIFHLVMNVKLI